MQADRMVIQAMCTSQLLYIVWGICVCVCVCVCVDPVIFFSAIFSFVVMRFQYGAIYYKPAYRQASFVNIIDGVILKSWVKKILTSSLDGRLHQRHSHALVISCSRRHRRLEWVVARVRLIRHNRAWHKRRPCSQVNRCSCRGRNQRQCHSHELE